MVGAPRLTMVESPCISFREWTSSTNRHPILPRRDQNSAMAILASTCTGPLMVTHEPLPRSDGADLRRLPVYESGDNVSGSRSGTAVAPVDSFRFVCRNEFLALDSIV